jgi:hypothetical protein
VFKLGGQKSIDLYPPQICPFPLKTLASKRHKREKRL